MTAPSPTVFLLPEHDLGDLEIAVHPDGSVDYRRAFTGERWLPVRLLERDTEVAS